MAGKRNEHAINEEDEVKFWDSVDVADLEKAGELEALSPDEERDAISLPDDELKHVLSVRLSGDDLTNLQKLGKETGVGATTAARSIIRRSFSTRSRSSGMSEENRLRVKRWVESSDWAIDDRQPSERFEWQFVFKPAAGRTITVLEQRQPAGRISVVGGLQIDKVHQKTFAKLSRDKRNALLVMMRRDAMLLGVMQSGLDEPLNTMQFRVMMVEEDLTEGNFNDAVLRIQNAIIHLRGLINVRLGESEGSQRANPPTPGMAGPVGDFIESLHDLEQL